MSETEVPTTKKGKGKKIFLLLGGALLLGGGGAALYASNAGLIGAGHAPGEPERPSLVLRDGVPESEAARYFSFTGDKRVDGTKFKPSYYPLAGSFTSNLRDEEGFLQVGLGVSTFYEQIVLDRVKLHEMAVRSAILLVLSEQNSDGLFTPKGKEALKARLRGAVNEVLKKKEGFGGIDEVYFTSFVIQ